jgi:hypothetical protein
LEIYGVGKVDGEGKTVDYEVDPFAEHVVSLALFLMKGQQHQHDVECIGVYDGRGVEKESASEDVVGIAEITGILEIILASCYLIYNVYEQQIPYCRCHRCRIFILPPHNTVLSFIEVS